MGKWEYLISFSNTGAVLLKLPKALETAKLSTMERYSVMQCLHTKIQQMI
jgi:hypothetical protein